MTFSLLAVGQAEVRPQAPATVHAPRFPHRGLNGDGIPMGLDKGVDLRAPCGGALPWVWIVHGLLPSSRMGQNAPEQSQSNARAGGLASVELAGGEGANRRRKTSFTE